MRSNGGPERPSTARWACRWAFLSLACLGACSTTGDEEVEEPPIDDGRFGVWLTFDPPPSPSSPVLFTLGFKHGPPDSAQLLMNGSALAELTPSNAYTYQWDPALLPQGRYTFFATATKGLETAQSNTATLLLDHGVPTFSSLGVVPPGSGTELALGLDAQDGRPVVAWRNTSDSSIQVARWNGVAWMPYPSPGSVAVDGLTPRGAVAAASGTVFVAWDDQVSYPGIRQTIYLWRWSGGWQQLAELTAVPGAIGYWGPTLALTAEGQPLLGCAFDRVVSGAEVAEPIVLGWTGSALQELGGAVGPPGGPALLGGDASGQPAAAFLTWPPSGGVFNASRWDGASWQQLDGPPVPIADSAGVAGPAVDSSGRLVVASQSTDGTVTVYRWSGAVWVNLGGPRMGLYQAHDPPRGYRAQVAVASIPDGGIGLLYPAIDQDLQAVFLDELGEDRWAHTDGPLRAVGSYDWIESLALQYDASGRPTGAWLANGKVVVWQR